MNPPSDLGVGAGGSASTEAADSTAFGCPRHFWGNRFVYSVLSARAGGLSVGINMNPDKRCNFDCGYCEVDRRDANPDLCLEIAVMRAELERMLELVESGGLVSHPCYQGVPAALLKLRQVALSGDGEPTLCPNFLEAVEAVIHLRARGKFPFFKLALVTNATGLERPEIAEALRLFTTQDEVWAKLEFGTPEYAAQINRPTVPLESIQSAILALARRRPVIIQSLFPSLHGHAPSTAEIDAYVRRLRALQEAGAQIPLVQVYSAARPAAHSGCGHLPLRTLSDIAQKIREGSGLRAEVY